MPVVWELIPFITCWARCKLTAKKLGSALNPTLVIVYGTTLLVFTYLSMNKHWRIHAECRESRDIHQCKADERRTIKSRPIFSAKLEQILLLNLSPKYRPIKSSDKIGRVTYKNRPIFCRPIKSAHKIDGFYRSSVIGLILLHCEWKLADCHLNIINHNYMTHTDTHTRHIQL